MNKNYSNLMGDPINSRLCLFSDASPATLSATSLLHCFLLILLLLLIVVPNPLYASMGTTAHLQTAIYQENYTTKPGDTLWLAVDIHITPEWHIYWQNPGDSGSAGGIDWTLPVGIKAGEIQWPTPKKIAMPPLMNYGYEERSTWLIPLHIAENAEMGELNIAATFFWLVCKEACIPESTEINFSIYTDQETIAQDSYQAFFTNARANLPRPLPWNAQVQGDPANYTLAIQLPEEMSNHLNSVYFYPVESGIAKHAAEQSWSKEGEKLLVSVPRDSNFPLRKQLQGVVTLDNEQGESVGFFVDLAVIDAAGVAGGSGEEQSSLLVANLSPLTAILLAFLGGLILNVMPCVFPVLSIKLLSLLRSGHHSRQEFLRHGFAYSAGVLATFLLVGGSLLMLRAGGAEIGWGFQLQSPIVVIALIYLFTLLGLVFAGLVSLNLIVSVSQDNNPNSSALTAFSGGVLAVVVASPCTVPFMGAALGYAFIQDTRFALPIFAALGAGMSLPYLMLCYFPALLKKLPKPGQWMVKFQQLMAFPMFATALWLLSVLGKQVALDLVFDVLLGLLLLTLALWVRNALSFTTGYRYIGLGVVVLAAAGLFSWHNQVVGLGEGEHRDRNWQAYSAKKLQALLDRQTPVFVNFTAEWCITCKVNEKLVLSQPSIKEFFKNKGITYLKGDWTQQDAEITRVLTEHGRSGVPLYLYFAAGSELPAVVLPELLTQDLVINTILKTENSNGTNTKSVSLEPVEIPRLSGR